MVGLAGEGLDVNTLPPGHLLGLLDEVVSHPARDRKERNTAFDEILLPAYLHEHMLHLVLDLGVPRLLVARDIGVHLVDANAKLTDTKKVEKTSVLARLALQKRA
jgi:hypothetical protein